jgi:hypothetical protein
MRACSLNYLACKEPPYCHLRFLCLYHIFRHYLINGKIFGKKLLNILKYVFSLSLQRIFKIFLILRRIQRDIVICMKTSSCKVPLFLEDLKKLDFPTVFRRKSPDLKFHQNPSSGSRVVSCGQTEGQTGMKKLIVAFRNFASTPQNQYLIIVNKKNLTLNTNQM